MSRRDLACWASLLLLAACEPEPVAGLYPERDALPAADAFVISRDAGVATGAALGDPQGTWLLYMHDRTCLSALNSAVEQVISTAYLVEIDPPAEGGAEGELYLTQRLRMCDQQVSPAVGGLGTTIPPSIPAHLPARALEAVVVPDAADLEAPSRYWSFELLDLWGLRASFDADEPLPDDPAHPQIYDQDEDGAPGMTIIVGDGLCDVYIVQRTRQRLSGASVSPHRVEGTFWSQVEKRVLGATNRLCESENVQTIGPNPYPFTLIRVDGAAGALSLDLDEDGAVGCEEINAALPALIEDGTLTAIEPEGGACDP